MGNCEHHITLPPTCQGQHIGVVGQHQLKEAGVGLRVQGRWSKGLALQAAGECVSVTCNGNLQICCTRAHR